jgi:hypothetical protein
LPDVNDLIHPVGLYSIKVEIMLCLYRKGKFRYGVYFNQQGIGMSLEVGKQLRAVRTAFGLSQRELARRVAEFFTRDME